MQYYKSISTIRGILGYSIQDFAQKAGFSKSFISRIEKNERQPSREAIKQMAEKLDVSENLFHILASDDTSNDTQTAKEVGKSLLELLTRNDKSK